MFISNTTGSLTHRSWVWIFVYGAELTDQSQQQLNQFITLTVPVQLYPVRNSFYIFA